MPSHPASDAFDIEKVRLPAERAACAQLEAKEGAAKRTFVPQNGATRRRTLMTSALLLTDTMAPGAYALAREALAKLGVHDRIELYQSRSGNTVRLVLYGDPIGIEFLGNYLDTLDAPELSAVLGHEIGHAIAHSGHAEFGWAIALSQQWTTGFSPQRRAYSIAAEMTADRFGLLASRDIDAVLRLEMKSVTGPSTVIHLDTAAYLKECQNVARAMMDEGGAVCGTSHPEHYVRAYAEWLFSESDLYASITGVGSGSRSIDDVNHEIADLLLPSAERRARARSRREERSGTAAPWAIPVLAPAPPVAPSSSETSGDRPKTLAEQFRDFRARKSGA